ncbi:DUF2490 domain-containing protein [Kaistella palustris]|uniref:DUF2490 domain-containing protein n=1 Tax=Kaistella palustris TaxID=493376 RepID=UPI000400CF3C|nr:DUF2490 domain-containing protein [Kaistella palustris]
MKKRGLILLLILIHSAAFAQEDYFSSNSTISVTYKINPNFFLNAEGNLRAYEDFSVPDYYEMKASGGYNLSEYHKLSVGFGKNGYYENELFDKREFQVWLQDAIELKSGKYTFENRLRAEKSWFYEPVIKKYSDRIRLRYRLNISVPLTAETVKGGALSANVYDEVFFITNRSPSLARNVIYGGLKYQLDENLAVASGYHFQREFARKGNVNYHMLYFAILISIDGSGNKTASSGKTD